MHGFVGPIADGRHRSSQPFMWNWAEDEHFGVLWAVSLIQWHTVPVLVGSVTARRVLSLSFGHCLTSERLIESVQKHPEHASLIHLHKTSIRPSVQCGKV